VLVYLFLQPFSGLVAGGLHGFLWAGLKTAVDKSPEGLKTIGHT